MVMDFLEPLNIRLEHTRIFSMPAWVAATLFESISIELSVQMLW